MLSFEARRGAVGGNRFHALRATRLAPLVGRTAELAILQRAWTRAADGEGQVVLMSGEPSIGKSRLLAAMLDGERTPGPDHADLRYQASPDHAGGVLRAAVEQIERAAGLQAALPPEHRLTRLREHLDHAGFKEGDLPLLAELLGIRGAGHSTAMDMAPQRKREQLFTLLLGQIECLARRGPVLVTYEDAHWLDASSMELLERKGNLAGRLPILVVVTVRSRISHAFA